MEQLIINLAPYAAILSSIISVAALGLILRISSQIRAVYKDRIDAAQDRNAVLEERLRLAEDKLKQLESIDTKVTQVGAALGIEEFQAATKIRATRMDERDLILQENGFLIPVENDDMWREYFTNRQHKNLSRKEASEKVRDMIPSSPDPRMSDRLSK